MRDLESPLLHRIKIKSLRRRGAIAMKKFIYYIIGLLAFILACTLPAYAAGPGSYHGSGGYQGSGGYRGASGYHGSGGYYGSGNYHGHGGNNGHGNSYNFGFAIGPGWGGWRPGWWGPAYPYYPYYPYYSAPPVVVERQPQVYVQQNQQESGYWYYCQNPEGYYPYVKSCPGGWMKVVPDTVPPGR
jgi:hypothetical protein